MQQRSFEKKKSPAWKKGAVVDRAAEGRVYFIESDALEAVTARGPER